MSCDFHKRLQGNDNLKNEQKRIEVGERAWSHGTERDRTLEAAGGDLQGNPLPAAIDTILDRRIEGDTQQGRMESRGCTPIDGLGGK